MVEVFEFDEGCMVVGVSIGVSEFLVDGVLVEELFVKVDVVMYVVKVFL